MIADAALRQIAETRYKMSQPVILFSTLNCLDAPAMAPPHGVDYNRSHGVAPFKSGRRFHVIITNRDHQRAYQLG